MKIGIVTYHHALNYGAVLQAYALQKCLTDLSIESEIIDYRCPYIEEFYRPVKKSSFKKPKILAREVLYFRGNYLKRKKFNAFINNNIKLSRTVSNEAELRTLAASYDVFIAGSDQIWNLKWSGDDKNYFLSFAESSKKYSFAASFGTSCISGDKADVYRDLLSDFRELSVRENSGQRIIQELVGRRSRVDVDPTLLLSEEEWSNIASEPNHDGYVLLYLLEKSDELVSYAVHLAKEKSLKVINIADAIKKSIDAEYCGFLSPSEFIGLIKKASYVVTNSFHGLMFSVIFKKKFVVAYQKRADAPNARIRDFLNDFELQDHLFTGSDHPIPEIDRNKVDRLVSKKVNESKRYLKNIEIEYEQNMPINLGKNKEECCGCRACEQICPVQAISMRPDIEGFLYPIIDGTKCVKCKKCINVCAFKNRLVDRVNRKPLQSVIGFHNNNAVRMHSRSGGFFVAASDIFLSECGTVYGAAFDKDFSVIHKRAVSASERDFFCGSKYVQSDTGHTFSEALHDLKNGSKVLYSGTACQVAGFLSFLRLNNVSDLESILTIDIICHGVMSPRIWDENLKYVTHDRVDTLKRVDFRDKKYGWNSHIESYDFGDHKINQKLYTSVFYGHCALRPSCYNCPYASVNRESDITLADAWGVGRVAPSWDIQKGVSLILINSLKGKSYYDKSSSFLTMQEVDLSDFMQPNMVHPTPKPAERHKFWQDFNDHGYVYVAKQCDAKQDKIAKRNRIKGKIALATKWIRK